MPLLKEDILAMRPRKLSFARIAEIHELTGVDVYSSEFMARVNKPGIGNALSMSYILMSPELKAASVGLKEYAEAMNEDAGNLKPITDACGVILTNFIQSQAPVEPPSAAK